MSYDPRAAMSRRHKLGRQRKRGIALGFSVFGLTLAMLVSACSSSGSSTSSSTNTAANTTSASASSTGSTNAAGSAGAATGDPIKLGISVPLSGAVGSSCGPMNKAMLAWFKHVNEAGGIDGRPIEVDNRDDGYDAARAVTNTKAFVEEKVLAVTGQCGSLQPPAQLPLLAAAKIPFLFTFGASTTLLNPLNPMYFNLMPTYGDQLVAAMPWVFEHQGVGSVVIMNTTTPDSEKTASEVTESVKKAGGTVAASYTAPPGTGDFAPYVLKMKNLNPEYVVLNQIPQDAARLTKQMTASQFQPKKNLVGSSAVSQATFLSTVDPAIAPKLIVTSDTIVPSDAVDSECGKVLKAAGLEIEGVTLRGCGTAQVVVKALQEAKKPLTSASLVSALESWNKVTASEIYPPVSFSSTNHVGVSSLYVFGVKDGAFYQIGQLS